MMFVYRDGAGAETLRKLVNFREDESYLRGYCEYSGGVRTFRKDRVVTHLDDDNCEAFAHVPLPNAGKSRDEVDDDYRLEVCFTGFKTPIRVALEAMATSGGMTVRKSVTANLDFLCVGDNAGPAKMMEAERKGCQIITADQLYDLINDGVLPDDFDAKKKSVKWTEISAKDAQQRFAGWVYQVKPAHWAALGIQWRSFTDKEKTAALRAWWEGENPRYGELKALRDSVKADYRQRKIPISKHPKNAEWEKLNKERAEKVYQYPALGISDPILLDFHEGDVFWNSFWCVQVVSGYAPLEVKYHEKDRTVTGYNLTEKRFAEWLKTGKAPEECQRIDRNQSQSAIARYYEYTQ